MLAEGEVERYSRQIRLFGEEGQRKLKNARVLVAGSGGLGSAVLIYLAAAGIGTIRMVDQGVVELSNLNRQILYSEQDVGRKKAVSAGEKLKGMNSELQVEIVTGTITAGNVDEFVDDFDLIVDALDSFAARHLLNRTASRKGIPLFHGAVEGFYGQATTVIPGKTACLRCIFPEGSPSATVPALGATCGVIGCIQATEVVKHVLGLGGCLENRLVMWDGLNCTLGEIVLERNPVCKDCAV